MADKHTKNLHLSRKDFSFLNPKEAPESVGSADIHTTTAVYFCRHRDAISCSTTSCRRRRGSLLPLVIENLGIGTLLGGGGDTDHTNDDDDDNDDATACFSFDLSITTTPRASP
uniref:Uncharacterized protein n=1 Tax=Ananas comosus var. bracteatus TaxID=296719 RepID=A0A6V7NSP0_ANACO|nr:unnamed protein product [Ananas comosus var. bracteatus]